MRRILLPILLLSQLLTAQQNAPAPSDDHALIQQLLQRVKDLEDEVKRLKGQPPAAVPTATVASPETAVQTPAQAAATTATTTVASIPPMQDLMHEASVPGLPAMQFRGFSDIRFLANNAAAGTPNTFALGQFNLFITSKMTQRFSMLSEVIVEAGSDNAMGIDLERLLVQYSANDHLNLSLGRYHSAIGYYNTAYHHSTWLQTTVDRPFLFAFEDDGGILPIHNVGLTANGTIPSGALGLHYVAEVGNGRASRSPLDEAVQNNQDENNRKSYNLAVFSRPPSIPGLQTGFSFYRDKLYPAGVPGIQQSIFAGHVVYSKPAFEFLNEVVVLRHAMANGAILHIPGFYSQISRAWGRTRPYFRYEYMNVPSRDPLFGDVGLLHGPIAGLRYDIGDFSAFKVEYFRNMRRDLSPIYGLRTQVSFTF
jgi:hypothetical protein